jgi:transposase-like protein
MDDTTDLKCVCGRPAVIVVDGRPYCDWAMPEAKRQKQEAEEEHAHYNTHRE